MGVGWLTLFSLHLKWRHYWAFLARLVVLRVNELSSVMCTPRNLVLLTLSTVDLLMCSGEWSTQILLKSTIISFFFSTLTDCCLYTIL